MCDRCKRDEKECCSDCDQRDMCVNAFLELSYNSQSKNLHTRVCGPNERAMLESLCFSIILLQQLLHQHKESRTQCVLFQSQVVQSFFGRILDKVVFLFVSSFALLKKNKKKQINIYTYIFIWFFFFYTQDIKITKRYLLLDSAVIHSSRQHQVLPLLKECLERVSNRHFVMLLHLEGVPQHKCSIAALQGYGKISETTLDSFIGEENNNNNNYYLNHDGGV
ncbi:hypothetical protein RFI_37951, partial [Reticulomyxa filosa]